MNVAGSMDCSLWQVTTEPCLQECDYGVYAEAKGRKENAENYVLNVQKSLKFVLMVRAANFPIQPQKAVARPVGAQVRQLHAIV